jgi:hypothetical protein
MQELQIGGTSQLHSAAFGWMNNDSEVAHV